MAFGGHTCTAVRTDEKRNLGQRALCHHCVRNDADIRAEANEFDTLQFRQSLEIFNQGRGTKAGLIKDRRVQNWQSRINLPALRFLYAVRDRKIPAFLCGQILHMMRIA